MATINNFKTTSRVKKKSGVYFTSPIDIYDNADCLKHVEAAAKEAIQANYLEDNLITKIAVQLAKFYYSAKI